ncbi:zeta toxin family protein [Shimazuella sp. AN120528]|uniref:AAA family ATPase n=1 Tax=Shimazuella soli TaxID=1892854 RepID=UPI001F103DAE|nr:AAA family ATPase [Shimazuella soli]MCH5585636.1 zeta toxin family protein [Shimazuella soli]
MNLELVFLILRNSDLNIWNRVKLLYVLKRYKKNEPIMVFMFGLPGAGKSTFVKKLEIFFFNVFGKEMDQLDPDLYFPSDYDKKNPDKYFDLTRAELDNKFKETILYGRWAIFQTGGSLLVPRGIKMVEAMGAGYYIFSILIDVKPEIARQRNEARDRTVEPEKFEECVQDLPRTFRSLKHLGAGSIKIKNN